MATVTITLTDADDKSVTCDSTFNPTPGHPLSPAQMAALDIIIRTNREWGVKALACKPSAPATHPKAAA